MVNYGHSEMEIDGLVTVLGYMPEIVSVYIDNEMRGSVNYASELDAGGPNIYTTNIMTYDVQNKYDKSYLLFRYSLIGEATYYPLSIGESELETVWNKYIIGTDYPDIVSLINIQVYDNGELCVYNLDN